MEHFKNLATPDIAESVHQSFWNEREGPPTPLNGPTYNSTENWNAKSLTSEEILLAIKHTNPNKAPGPDQISPAFFAAVCTLTDEERESNKFWTILDRVCKDLFESTNMPDNVNEALIVPIPKKGDPTNPGNYRGISLINVIMKIVTKVVYERLAKWADDFNILSREQAGFRKNEECVAQVCCLIEIIQRRTKKWRPTSSALT
jgi:membrane dipeptidase/U5 small nuclear ribonucleoprotein component